MEQSSTPRRDISGVALARRRAASRPFSAATGVAYATIVLLAGAALISIGEGFAMSAQASLVDRIIAGDEVGGEEIEANDALVAALAASYSVSVVLTAIVFLIWFHRAYRNLPALGWTDISPGAWAVVVWFVPIVNLYRPPLLMSAIWKGSDPAVAVSATGRMAAPSGRSTPLILLWWIAWVASGPLAQGSLLVFGREGLDGLAAASSLGVWSNVSAATAAATLIVLIKRIDARQLRRMAAMHDVSAF